MRHLSYINCLLQLVFVVITSSSCSCGPRAQAIGIPEKALERAMDATNEDPIFNHEESIPEDWWLIFNDTQLSGFIETALENNPTLQSAHAKILAAQYNADKVQAALYPHFNFMMDVQRQKLSKTGVIPAGPTLPSIPVPSTPNSGIPFYFTLFDTQINFIYDFDFWGKNRNTLRAALGEVQANIADEIFARLALSISVAQVYYRLQIDYQRQEIAEELVKNRQEFLDLTQQRVQKNLDDERAFHNAQINLSAARQALLQIQGDIAVNEYQLQAYLAGSFEEEIANIKISPKDIPAVPLPRELPLHLISYRPDITAQLWLIQSAGLQIEVAKAGFYPDFNLTGFLGMQTIHLHKWFFAKSAYYNIEPAFTLPIFDGGLLVANLRGSEVNYDLAIYEYNNMVLNAIRDVLDGMAVLQNENGQLDEFKQEAMHQNEISQLTEMRANHHLSSGLDTLNAQANFLTARDNETISIGRTMMAVLSLVKALGGGYDAFCTGRI